MIPAFKTTAQECAPEFPKRLVAKGAVLTLNGEASGPILVGEWTPLTSSRVFLFPAHGEEGDEQILEFDRAVLLDTQIVGFIRGSDLVGQLAAISAAGLDDPDDYRVAWQIWQHVSPMMQEKIDQLRARRDPDY